MRTRFDTSEWHTAVAKLVRSGDAYATGASLVEVLDLAVDHEGTCMLVFHRDAPPEVVHHSLDAAGARHFLDRYVAGPYLLDPLYELALRDDIPSVCRFRDMTPDRFRSSEYYRQYCERTHLLDEIDFLINVSDRSTLVLVVGRLEKMFTKSELDRLHLIEPVILAAMRNIWERRAADENEAGRGGDLHQRLTRCFDNFGNSLLTEREREITQLLLRGHSAKSVARALQIAPGTVMVHKRNLFSKLGITSQYELFSRFIDDLSRS